MPDNIQPPNNKQLLIGIKKLLGIYKAIRTKVVQLGGDKEKIKKADNQVKQGISLLRSKKEHTNLLQEDVFRQILNKVVHFLINSKSLDPFCA